jgi:uncharacterized protein
MGRSVCVVFATITSVFLVAGSSSTTSMEICWNEGSSCDRVPSTAAPVKEPRRAKATLRPKATPRKTPATTASTAPSVQAPTNAAGLYRLAIQVNERDETAMNLALNNAKNVIDYYKAKGRTTLIEIVAYGPGLHMLRDDTSPVKDRIASFQRANANISVVACGNSQANQSQAEGKPVSLIAEAKIVPSGVVRLIELQQQGYAYIRP